MTTPTPIEVESLTPNEDNPVPNRKHHREFRTVNGRQGSRTPEHSNNLVLETRPQTRVTVVENQIVEFIETVEEVVYPLKSSSESVIHD